MAGGNRQTGKTKTVDINYRVFDIALMRSENNIPVDLSENRSSIKFALNVNVREDEKNSTLDITILYRLSKEEKEIYALDVKTTFLFLRGFRGIKDGKFMKHVISLSIDHARGVNAIAVKDTILSEFLLPIVSPDKMVSE